MNVRDELVDKLARMEREMVDIVKTYLPEEALNQFLLLRVKMCNLEDYLREHNDEYIEKDKAFDHSRCPRNVTSIPQKEPCLAELPFFKECNMTECPEFPTCDIKGPLGRIEK